MQAQSLKDYKISKVYSESEAKENVFESISGIKSIDFNDINKNFSNVQDLYWLKQVAQNNKIVLIGETHYSKNIENIKNRIIFALNNFDYFPLIIIEREYSVTPYLNHFINLKNENDAKSFFNKELSTKLNTVEDSIFIEHIRNWNIKNPKKNIKLGCIDLEWSWDEIMEDVLMPYFIKLDDIDKSEIDKIFEIGLNQSDDFFIRIEPLIKKAEEQNLIGEYSFVNIEYVKNVIESISTTFKAMSLSSWWEYFRQKEIAKRVTNQRYFGEYFKNQKVIMYGGGNHMKSKHYYGVDDNFISEGSYLNFDNKPTKGKVYSIMLNGISFSLGEMKDVNLNDAIIQGTQYKKITNRMQKAYKEGLLNPDENYFLFGFRNEFEKFIFSKSYQYKDSGIVIPDKVWNEIVNVSIQLSNDIQMTVEMENESRNDYDEYVYIPYSPLTIARKNVW
tara:strand:+ start:1562 stop:2902 length:1341 start_codon:yes stop_codon:yes gene_type:complete